MPKWLYRPKGSPYWHYDFVLNGCRVFGSTKTDKPALARRIVEGKRAEVLTGTLAKRAPEMTVDHAFGRWLTEHGVHLKERDNLEARLGRLVDHLGQHTLLSEVADDQLTSYVGRHRTDLSAFSVNNDLKTLRRVLGRAAKLWRVALPPPIHWRDLFLVEPPPKERHLSRDEEGRLLAVLPADLGVMVRFALLTGARLDTIIRLTWRDVDDERATITLQEVKSTRRGETHTLPITAAVRALLGSRRGQHPTFVFTYPCQRTTRDRKGGKREAGERYPFSDTGWRKPWARALAATGLEGFRFHDLRHTAATRITKATGNLRVTQRTLGHKSITTTQRYAHVLLEDVAEGMEAASRNLPEKKNRPGAPDRLSLCITTKTEGQSDDRTTAPKAGALPG